MSEYYGNNQMLDMYLFETTQNIEQLEICILDTEKSSCYAPGAINEIFRIMHTIKGSSAMMLYNNIANLAHVMEDLFYYIREENPTHIDCSALSDLLLEGVDFIKVEVHKIKNGLNADGDCSRLVNDINDFLSQLRSLSKDNSIKAAVINISQEQAHYYIAPDTTKNEEYCNCFKAIVYYEDGCEMENVRAYSIIHNLNQMTNEIYYIPNDIIDDDESINLIKEYGFVIYFKINKSYQEMHEFFMQTIFLKDLDLKQLENDEEYQLISGKKEYDNKNITIPHKVEKVDQDKEINYSAASNQSIISVNVEKLDKLMDLVGEMVIAEALVTQNPELNGLILDNFHKAARQLQKITNELQDLVMSIRMVPLSTTFHKMHRIVRDMNKKLGKEVQLELLGEETEVDKNIIERISDPIMHLVRNAIDHGIETPGEREMKGKSKNGRVTLEAKNAGSDVLIIIKDDGKGINKASILRKAKDNNLLVKAEDEMTEKEIYNLLFLPGFSMKDNVTEFSGRGVGMDVVTKNIEAVGGSISIESIEGSGTIITLKIPLTLAIIDGMNIQVGKSRYTIPITAIRESFRPKESDIIRDPDENEMIMVRGNCYPILRLHEFYNVQTDVLNFNDGIFIMVEQDDKAMCIFADELLGQQQVVVKALPGYIKNTRKIQGLAGCTLLGDGNISLILDIAGLINK